MTKSHVVREPLSFHGERMGRLTVEERDRLVTAFDRAMSWVPDRPRAEVEAELAEVARARKSGGRRSE